jgi:PAS domain S-box-containing protein
MNEARYDDLRRRAESYLHQHGDEVPIPPAASNLIEELNVYQAELVVQNEELRDAQHKLATARNKYLRLFDLAPVGYLTVDRKGAIFDINLRCAEWLAVGRERILAGNVPLVSLLREEGHVPLHDALKKLFVDGAKPPPMEVQPRRSLPDSRILQVEAALMRDEDDKDLALLTFTDVTSLRENERQLQSAKDDWERTFNTVPDMICILDAHYNVLRANRAFADYLGRPIDACIGEKCYRLMHRTSAPPDDCPHCQFMGTGAPNDGEIHDPETDRHFHVSVTPLHDAKGRPAGCVHVSREVTQRKRDELKLRAALENSELLLREVHHRVKNNLQVIIHLVARKSLRIPDPDVKQFLAELQEQARTMSLVYEQLEGKSKQLADVDMTRYLSTLSQNLLHSFCSGQGPAIHVLADGVRLSVDFAMPCGLIVNELLTNSIKHAFRKRPASQGVVHVSLERRDGAVLLVFEDNGDGFDPAAPSPKSASGLDLVRLWASHQLGGTLECASRPNQGTRYSISFPADFHSPKAAP